MKIVSVYSLALVLAGVTASADTIYNAGLGTLPQAQGFSYSGDNGNASPFVSGGLLYENTTVGNQYWITTDPSLDFSKSVTLEGVLLVNSSNYVGGGTDREGYYFQISDKNSWVYDIGLASNGFLINNYPTGRSLISYSIAGGFHTYLLTINDYTASFSIDGKVIQSGIAAQNPRFLGPFPSRFLFGAGTDLKSNSNTELRATCVVDSATPCLTTTTTPEPNSFFLLLPGAGLLFVSRIRRLRP